MKEYYIIYQGEKIPIITYNNKDGRVETEPKLSDIFSKLSTILARNFADSYKKYSDSKLKELIKELSMSSYYTLDFTKEETIKIFISRYFELDKSSVDNNVTNRISIIMHNRLKQEIKEDGLLKKELSSLIDQDEDYLNVYGQLVNIIGDLEKDIKSSCNTDIITKLIAVFCKVLEYFAGLKNQIISIIIQTLKDTQDYKENKNQAYKLIPSVIEEDTCKYLKLDRNIRAEDVLEFVPSNVIFSAYESIINGHKNDYYIRLIQLIKDICAKIDDHEYSELDIQRVILNHIRILLSYDDQELTSFLNITSGSEANAPLEENGSTYTMAKPN